MRPQVLRPAVVPPDRAEPPTVVRVHELVRERVFHVRAGHESVLAQQDPEVGREPAGERGRAGTAGDGEGEVRGGRVGGLGTGWGEERDVLQQEPDDRTCCMFQSAC